MTWDKHHDEITGIGSGEVQVDEAADPYPAMVYVEIPAGSILADDARSYALILLAAAEVADQRNDVYFAAIMDAMPRDER